MDAEDNFNWVVTEGFSQEGTFELRPEKEAVRERVLERMCYVEGKVRAKTRRCVRG